MSQEITKLIAFKTTKNGGVDSLGDSTSSTRVFDQTGDFSSKWVQTITAAADVALAIPATVTFPCHLVVDNRDSSNPIDLSIGTGGSFAANTFSRVPAGDAIVIVATRTVYGKATGADCKTICSAGQV